MNRSREKAESTDSKNTSSSIATAILNASQVLQEAGVPEARREAGSLLSYVISRDRTFLISHAEDSLDTVVLDAFAKVIQRRAQGEPQQYITGHQEFFGLEFKVTRDVLIPRPETELLVESALSLLSDRNQATLICDVGTGSGCIAVALLHARPSARAVAIDISEAAIQIARANALRHAVSDRISLLVANCFASLKSSEPGFDLIVSNPPYVSAAAMSGLQREVRDHEPHFALTPGGDGLSIIRRLLKDGADQLRTGGHLLFEIGFDQGADVRQMVSAKVWRLVEIQPDLQGIPRIVALQKVQD
jgi:release factor glutamine methyltransferase